MPCPTPPEPEQRKNRNDRPIQFNPNRAGKQAQDLQDKLRTLIIGQNEAIDEIVDIYQMYLTGLTAPGRPIGNFLFLGLTGSGKTRTVEATAEVLMQNSSAVIKIDCGEFQHSDEIVKLIGSPPGYLGHRETHPLLSQEVINKPHTETMKISFVLFDEIEKASDAATLTLEDNRRVDFSRAMIFMTSKLGACEMSALSSPKLGVQGTRRAGPADIDLASKMSKSAVEAARRKFTPEFMNRIDKIAVFRPRGTSELRCILDLELRQVQQRLLHNTAKKPFVFCTTDVAKSFLLAEGTEIRYSARHLKRTIERLLVRPLSNLMASNQVNAGDCIELDFDDEAQKLSFAKIDQGLSSEAMANLAENGVSVHVAAARAA